MRTALLLLVLFVLISVWWFRLPVENTSTVASVMEVDASDKLVRPKLQVGINAENLNKEAIEEILAIKNIPVDEIESFGYGAIPILTELYSEAESNSEKSRIAWVFWRLGWKSPEIEQAMAADLESNDANLKVWVQWGIAKSTQSSEVINKLVYNLENDPSPFVRDKAACALASDFIHISPSQRLIILKGLVAGLDNEILQVRKSSLQALQIQTGQSKGFVPTAEEAERAQSIAEWNQWLEEYEQSL